MIKIFERNMMAFIGLERSDNLRINKYLKVTYI